MSTEEAVFHQDEEVLITNTRAVLRQDTYSMANITSVRARVKPANPLPGIVIAAVGLLPTACCGCSTLGILPMVGSGELEDIGAGLMTGGASLAGAIFGLLIVAGGVALAVAAKPSHIVVIGTAGGEKDALSSKDSDYVTRVVRALNEAIVHRG
jgi:hypothetical protein